MPYSLHFLTEDCNQVSMKLVSKKSDIDTFILSRSYKYHNNEPTGTNAEQWTKRPLQVFLSCF